MLPEPVLSELRTFMPPGGMMLDPAELSVYDCDGFTIARAVPGAVLFPETAEQVASIVRTLARASVPIVPRGSGTGLAGGSVAFEDGAIVSTARLNRILSIDLPNRVAHVQAGVRNTDLSAAVAKLPDGAAFHFAPDPSSQRASTIGGNAATNAGGIHTLKDFVSSNHVLGLEMVLADGEIVQLGAANGCYEAGPFDWPGIVCGSEGTFGIITSLWVRLVPKATDYRTIVGLFASSGDACDAVSRVIAEGILPAAMEMLDGAMVSVVENTFHFGFPPQTQALVLTEIDGIADLLAGQSKRIEGILRDHHATGIQSSADADTRAKLWKARKAAFGAIGKISPSYCTQDACVPRSMLRQVLEKVDEIGKEHGLQINNVFHAGDGNVHPIFLYDDRDAEQVQNVLHAAEKILQYCIDLGGTATGEHGVGVEKLHLMPYQFDAATLQQFAAIKHAFDPHDRINAGKVFPSETMKVTLLKPGRHVPQ
jgi:glycolate oxidase